MFQNRILPCNHFKRSKVSLRKSSTSLGRRTSRVHRRRVRFTRRGWKGQLPWQNVNQHRGVSSLQQEADSQERYIICIVYIYLEPFDDLYFWRSTFQNKAFSYQNNGHLGSSFQVYSIMFLSCKMFFNIISIGCGTIINHDFWKRSGRSHGNVPKNEHVRKQTFRKKAIIYIWYSMSIYSTYMHLYQGCRS